MRLTLSVAVPEHWSCEDEADLSLTLSGYRVLEGAADIEAVEIALAAGDSVEILNAEADFKGLGTVKFMLNIYAFDTHESQYAEFKIWYENFMLAPLA